jgi:hypothetical protein
MYVLIPAARTAVPTSRLDTGRSIFYRTLASGMPNVRKGRRLDAHVLTNWMMIRLL